MNRGAIAVDLRNNIIQVTNRKRTKSNQFLQHNFPPIPNTIIHYITLL
jgi:hypothetical protein